LAYLDKILPKNAKPVTYVIPFIKMKLLLTFHLPWWNKCGFTGSVGAFTIYDLFIVTTDMLEWRDHRVYL